MHVEAPAPTRANTPATDPATRSVVVPLPHYGFDPIEAVAEWKVLRDRGYDVKFATPDGLPARADDRMLNGVVFGRLGYLVGMGSSPEVVRAYRELEREPAFARPLRWTDVDPNRFAGLVLPGNQDEHTRPYLESDVLQHAAAGFMSLHKPIAAMCHGVLLLARAKDPATGESLIAHRKVTTLPKYMEQGAWLATNSWLGDYFRTYPTTYTERLVKSALADPARQYSNGPLFVKPWVQRDDNLVSGRWQGDAPLLASTFADMLDAARMTSKGAS